MTSISSRRKDSSPRFDEQETQLVTAVIPCRNEANNLEMCIESVRKLTGSIVVVDDSSTDRTVEIAESLGCTVLTPPTDLQVGLHQGRVERLFMWGIEQVKTPYCLRLDADERLTPDLVQFSRMAMRIGADGARARRRNYFLGDWLRHGGWHDPHQLFLVRCESIDPSWDAQIHGQIPINGDVLVATGEGDGYLDHHDYNSVREFVDRTLGGYAQEDQVAPVRSAKASGLILESIIIQYRFSRRLFGRLLLRRGIRDGQRGLAAATLLATYDVLRSVYGLEARLACSSEPKALS